MKDPNDPATDLPAAASKGSPNPGTIGKTTVASFVWDEVHKADWAAPNEEGRTGRVKNRRGEFLLGIMTYAYAIGLYRSREIQRELLRSPEALSYFSEHPLTPQSLRQFRRLNKDLIKHCLRDVFDRAVKAKGNSPKAALLGSGGQPLSTTIRSSVRLPLAAKEAETRVHRAVEEDHIDSED